MTLERPVAAPPRRGTRPRNRRALILKAATALFYRRGYDHVSMGDIADAVGIGPSALYRHFPGKQQLLRTVILDGLVPIREQLDDLDLTDRATALPALARLALEHRELGVLWQREAHHVAADDISELRGELHEIGRALACRIQAARPDLSPAAADLLAWSIVATLISVSFHHLDLPGPEYEDLLADFVGIVLNTDFPDDFPEAPPSPSRRPALMPKSRREALLAQAIRMFAVQGYSRVGIQDIGAAVGVTGPSIYSHFGSKLELLVTALSRGTAVLFMDLTEAYVTAPTPTDALRQLIHAYIRFATRNHHLIDIMITETEHLPEEERHRTRQAQHSYIDEWVHLLRSVHPELDTTSARIRVQAALTVANDVTRTSHLRRNPATPDATERICTHLLRLPSQRS